MSADPESERVLSGRYRLDAVFGKGGMGIVHRGTDLVLDRPVAIKLLYPMADPVAQERFLREAKTTARIRHPSIVEVFDFGQTDDGELFLVMEMLDGRPLSSLLDGATPLSPEQCVQIACDIAGALSTAHQAGVVHRDLKPANVMLLGVPGPGGVGRIKLLDFGIAKSILSDGQQLTGDGMMVGTLEYMAPEQILGEAIDERTDVYALGCLMYRMLVGRTPAAGETAAQVIHKHLSVAATPPSDVASHVDASLDAIVLRCLAKSMGARYATMDELASALRSVDGTRSERRPRLSERPAPSAGRADLPELPELELRAATSRAPQSVQPTPPVAVAAGQISPDTSAGTTLGRNVREIDPDDDELAPALDVAVVDAAPARASRGPSLAAPPGTLAESRVCLRCGARLERYALSCAACGGTDAVNVHAEQMTAAPRSAREMSQVPDGHPVWLALEKVPQPGHTAAVALSFLGIVIQLARGQPGWLVVLVPVLMVGALGLYAHNRR